jgi:hypothetical protein
MKTLLGYASNRHSQNGEDGILHEICKRLAIKKGWFVEFGASDGISLSNTFALLEDGWEGVDIEGDTAAFKKLVRTAKRFPGRLHAIQAYVAYKGKDSLDQLLATTPLPKNFDVLSIDIDSHDYWLWKSLTKYSPKVVVIEINSHIAPGKKQVQQLDDGDAGASGSGSSFTSMLELGKEKGYTLVCHTGNMIFVRDDLIKQLKLPQEELDNPNQLFRYEFLPPSVLARLRRKLNYILNSSFRR